MFANELDNLGEMAKFLERQKLSRLIQEQQQNLNRPKMGKDILLVTEKTSHKEKSKANWLSLVNSIKHLKKN